MDKRSGPREARGRRKEFRVSRVDNRVHPELVGMLYATLDSGKQVAWLRLRIPGRTKGRGLEPI